MVEAFLPVIPLLIPDPFGEIHVTNLEVVLRLHLEGRAKKVVAVAGRAKNHSSSFVVLLLSLFTLPLTRGTVHGNMSPSKLMHYRLFCGLIGM